MAFGDTATVLLTEKKLKIKWNTGVVVDEKPVYYNQTISVENDITPQEAYDIAFKLDWHPHKLYSCRNRIRKRSWPCCVVTGAVKNAPSNDS